MSNEGLHPYAECAGCDHQVEPGVACDQCPHEIADHERKERASAYKQPSYEYVATLMSDPDDPDSSFAVKGIE